MISPMRQGIGCGFWGGHTDSTSASTSTISKEITTAQRIIETIDPVLARLRQQNGVQPGPRPTNRQTGHTEPEEFVGNSGMITWLWLDNLRRDCPAAGPLFLRCEA
jgi:hypothetical protein